MSWYNEKRKQIQVLKNFRDCSRGECKLDTCDEKCPIYWDFDMLCGAVDFVEEMDRGE